MRLNKKGAGTSNVIITLGVGVVVVILVLAAINMGLFNFGQAAIAGGEQATTETGDVVLSANVDCPSDGTTDGQLRYEDGLAASTTYGTPVCYFVSQTAGEERITAGSLATSGAYSTAVDIKCTEAGVQYKPVCTTQANNWSSVEGTAFTSEGAFAKRDLIGAATDTIKVKVEDKVTGGAKFFNITSCEYGKAGAYVSSNGTTKCEIRNGDAGETGTSLTLGADEFIDAKFYVRTNNTKRTYGEDGLKTWMLVDADSNLWNEPTVNRDNGPTLVDAIDSLQAEDIKKYSGFEYAYEIGPIGTRESEINFFMETASGVNVGATADPTVEFCAEGRYDSSKQKDTILVGCWTDASTQAEVVTTYRQHFKFDVS